MLHFLCAFYFGWQNHLVMLPRRVESSGNFHIRYTEGIIQPKKVRESFYIRTSDRFQAFKAYMDNNNVAAAPVTYVRLVEDIGELKDAMEYSEKFQNMLRPCFCSSSGDCHHRFLHCQEGLDCYDYHKEKNSCEECPEVHAMLKECMSDNPDCLEILLSYLRLDHYFVFSTDLNANTERVEWIWGALEIEHKTECFQHDPLPGHSRRVYFSALNNHFGNRSQMQFESNCPCSKKFRQLYAPIIGELRRGGQFRLGKFRLAGEGWSRNAIVINEDIFRRNLSKLSVRSPFARLFHGSAPDRYTAHILNFWVIEVGDARFIQVRYQDDRYVHFINPLFNQ